MIETWLGYDIKYGKYVVKSHNSDDGESDGAVPGRTCWIIREIQVKITQPWFCSSERERLRGKSYDTSPIKDVRWLQLFIQSFFLHLFFASKIYNKIFNTKIATG